MDYLINMNLYKYNFDIMVGKNEVVRVEEVERGNLVEMGLS